MSKSCCLQSTTCVVYIYNYILLFVSISLVHRDRDPQIDYVQLAVQNAEAFCEVTVLTYIHAYVIHALFFVIVDEAL